MTAPLYAATTVPPSVPPSFARARHDAHDAHDVDRRAAVAAHPASGPAGRARREAVLADLLAQAYLFDDPEAYEAGVRDAYDRFAAAAS
jgi:hypothetical protein